MTRVLSAVGVLLVVSATPPIHAGQPGQGTAITRVAPSTTAAARVTVERMHALTSISGNALDSTFGQLPNVVVRLRDARFGRITDTQYTDQSGMFSFRAVEPGSYIVEIVGNDQSILAASELVNVNAGEAVLAVVKLPFNAPPFAGLIGTSTSQAATWLVVQAAATGITALVPTAPISPNR